MHNLCYESGKRYNIKVERGISESGITESGITESGITESGITGKTGIRYNIEFQCIITFGCIMKF